MLHQLPFVFSELLSPSRCDPTITISLAVSILLFAFRDTPLNITVISCASAGMPLTTSVPDADCSANNTNELPPEPLPPLPVISFPLTYN